MTHAFLKSLCLVALLAAPAFAQVKPAPSVKPYVGEVVVSSTGSLVAPWKEIRTCNKAGACVTVIANPKTHEVAKYGDRWSTRFASTGNGKEVKRAEPALDKAIRLNSFEPTKPK